MRQSFTRAVRALVLIKPASLHKEQRPGHLPSIFPIQSLSDFALGAKSRETNLGLVGMAHSAEGITVDMLQCVSQIFLTETTLGVFMKPGKKLQPNSSRLAR
jgi:hypothetical protein